MAALSSSLRMIQVGRAQFACAPSPTCLRVSPGVCHRPCARLSAQQPLRFEPQQQQRRHTLCLAGPDDASEGPRLRDSTFPSNLSSADDASTSSQADVEATAAEALQLVRSDSDVEGTLDLTRDAAASAAMRAAETDEERTAVQKFFYPSKEELPDELQMPIWDHLEELRERALVAALASTVAVLGCFYFSKDLVVFLEAPVAGAGVRFLQLSPGEFFFTTLKVAGYCGLLTAVPTVLYEIISYVIPGLTKAERNFLAPIILGSSVLFYFGLIFSYEVLTPAALNFFVEYADGAVESLWSIDQYFEFVLVLMLSTGLSFQVPVIQVMIGQLGIVNSDQMFAQWRFVLVGATIAAAVLTPSTDPFTQSLLAAPLIALYFGGATVVKLIENGRAAPTAA